MFLQECTKYKSANTPTQVWWKHAERDKYQKVNGIRTMTKEIVIKSLPVTKETENTEETKGAKKLATKKSSEEGNTETVFLIFATFSFQVGL